MWGSGSHLTGSILLATWVFNIVYDRWFWYHITFLHGCAWRRNTICWVCWFRDTVIQGSVSMCIWDLWLKSLSFFRTLVIPLMTSTCTRCSSCMSWLLVPLVIFLPVGCCRATLLGDTRLVQSALAMRGAVVIATRYADWVTVLSFLMITNDSSMTRHLMRL